MHRLVSAAGAVLTLGVLLACREPAPSVRGSASTEAPITITKDEAFRLGAQSLSLSGLRTLERELQGVSRADVLWISQVSMGLHQSSPLPWELRAWVNLARFAVGALPETEVRSELRGLLDQPEPLARFLGTSIAKGAPAPVWRAALNDYLARLPIERNPAVFPHP